MTPKRARCGQPAHSSMAAGRGFDEITTWGRPRPATRTPGTGLPADRDQRSWRPMSPYRLRLRRGRAFHLLGFARQIYPGRMLGVTFGWDNVKLKSASERRAWCLPRRGHRGCTAPRSGPARRLHEAGFSVIVPLYNRARISTARCRPVGKVSPISRRSSWTTARATVWPRTRRRLPDPRITLMRQANQGASAAQCRRRHGQERLCRLSRRR